MYTTHVHVMYTTNFKLTVLKKCETPMPSYGPNRTQKMSFTLFKKRDSTMFAVM